jgi:predicted transcriptional regulator
MKSRFELKNLRLTGRGLDKVLGDLETKIMQYLWRKEAASVRAVRESLNKNNKTISFNAVMTVMNRLVDKKMLRKNNKDGVYTYRPVMTKDEFSRLVTKDIIDAVVKDPALFSAASFAELADDLDKDALEKLRDFVMSSKK